MIPKQIYRIIHTPHTDIINSELSRYCFNGWKIYGDLKVIYYGTKEHEKIYIQIMVYNRTWIDYLFRRKYHFDN
jgi:hypothetical protein